jgi:hypothetical protein
LTNRFAIATRDELWLHGRLVERRLSLGEAVEGAGGIVATDARDDALVEACDAEMERLRAHVVPGGRVRLVAEATVEGVTGAMTVTIGDHSIVTTPEELERDLGLLNVSDEKTVPFDGRDRAKVWLHGTASVLLHEALGHPREHGHAELDWPSWLEVDVPIRPRRATFRDVPLLRMTHLAASQTNAPFALPAERIEIHLIDGGSYEPLTEMVTIRVAVADLIVDGKTRRLAPFEITRPRRDVAASLLGATGDPIRYPGVICSREGQELVVGSFAPVMVTR